MSDESEEISNTLAWTCRMILESGPEDRQRIALAYREAQTLVASIPKNSGDARPRIAACIKRSDTYRAVDDIACVGWTLTAIEERVDERNLPIWRQLRKIIYKILRELPLSKPAVH
ncbi:hypothetical protein [Mesorhizobium sp. M4A.F.Ca.ET.022.05.2.1]|uniref:hypothetical protein n=1 Tax=Mesorhizobium sp. M4A.F.Ca.ET.022.05.2.1 TaxID=2496653 RepID=UPI0016786E58|nr:hypothetical protein [Mesorhizobium sp. M4A.F.Ca.ET.022.05.2.1]